MDKPVNFACALFKDMRTVKPLFVDLFDEKSQQVFIQFVNNTAVVEESPYMKINEIAYIYYGYNDKNETCNSTYFQYSLTEGKFEGDNVFTGKLSHGLENIMGSAIVPS